MGGGGAMRAAAKVAGIGFLNSGIRGGISAVPSQAEHSVRNVSRPVSAILSSGMTTDSDLAAVQRPSREVDEWEFCGGEEELLLDSGEPMPRLVFGGPPSLLEAKEATSELKNALEKIYLSSPSCVGSGDSSGDGQLSGLSLSTNSDKLENKSCIVCEPKAAPGPKYAIRACELLNQSPAVQSVVASIASDPSVWDAVWKNEALVEYIQSSKTTVPDAELQEPESTRKFTELFDDASSKAGNFENGFMETLGNIKVTVVEMMNNISAFVQNIFGFSSAENISGTSDGNAKPSFMEKTLGASFMALAVMVIMVVVLKRG